MRSRLLLLVVAVSVGAIGYQEIRQQAAREAWRAEATRLTGRLEEAERQAKESEQMLSNAGAIRRQEAAASARLADLEVRMLDAATQLAMLESDRSVAENRAEVAIHDLKRQVRALATIEMDMSALDQRRQRLERHVESVEARLHQAETGAAKRQKRAEALDRDIAALAIRRETLWSKLKSTERHLAEATLAKAAEQTAKAVAPSPAEPKVKPKPAPVAVAVAAKAPIIENAPTEKRDRTRGLYQFGSLSAAPEATGGGQGGLPPASESWSDGRDPTAEAGNWAEDQYLLGLSLVSKAEGSSGTLQLNDAILAFKAVLGEWPRERDPMRWAIAQSDLGYALALLGKRQSDSSVLEQAATACREALGTLKQDDTPLLWAAAQHHLGVSLGGLADISGDADLWRVSIDALERSVAAFKGAGAETDARKVAKRLREAYAHVEETSAE